jgi:hypothetical protein
MESLAMVGVIQLRCLAANACIDSMVYIIFSFEHSLGLSIAYISNMTV